MHVSRENVAKLRRQAAKTKEEVHSYTVRTHEFFHTCIHKKGCTQFIFMNPHTYTYATRSQMSSRTGKKSKRNEKAGSRLSGSRGTGFSGGVGGRMENGGKRRIGFKRTVGYLYVCICTYICIYMQLYACVCVCVSICVCMYKCEFMYVRTHTHTHTHTCGRIYWHPCIRKCLSIRRFERIYINICLSM
jgi:hypothetical protein